ncbi:type 4 pilus major pilin [Plesiomonas shigelloides subsp. oncorhynchi]|nr:type 4 pilus major pilin [Plesiomonas shigelloides]
MNSHITTLIAETKSVKDRNGYGDGKANVNLIPILIKREKIPTSMKKMVTRLKMILAANTRTLQLRGFGYEVGTTNIPAAICISTVSMQAKAGIASTTKINSNTFNGPVSNAQAEAACNQDKKKYNLICSYWLIFFCWLRRAI